MIWVILALPLAAWTLLSRRPFLPFLALVMVFTLSYPEVWGFVMEPYQ